MINTDKNIRDIFSQKLHDIEADVPDSLWESISQQLPDPSQAAGAGGPAGSAAKIGFSMTKLLIAAGIAASVVTGAVFLNSDTELKNDQKAVVTPQNTSANSIVPMAASVPESVTPAVVNTPGQDALTTNSVDQNTDAGKTSKNNDNTVANDHSYSDRDQSHTNQHLSPVVAHPALSGTDTQTDPKSVNNSPISERPAIVTPNAKFSVITVSESNLDYRFVPEDQNAASYSWSINGTKTSSEQIFSKRFDDEGEYAVQLTVSYKDGSSATKEIVVKAIKPADFFIPNVFTPNGDGRNDTFDPQSRSNNITITKVVILDNKGKVFESDSAAQWDGSDMSGNECVTGNYYYLIRAIDRSNQIIEKTGSVRLIRN